MATKTAKTWCVIRTDDANASDGRRLDQTCGSRSEAWGRASALNLKAKCRVAVAKMLTQAEIDAL